MLHTKSDPPIVSFSVSTYRLLLVFYPNAFRREYGSHMAQVFRDTCLQTLQRDGPPGILALWALTLFDWFKTLVEEHLERGTHMTTTKFIRLSGWGMSLAGLSVMLGFLGSNEQNQGVLWRRLGLWYATTDTIATSLLLGGSLLLVLGMLGVYLRYRDRIGVGGKASLIGGMVFGLVSIFGGWMLAATDSEFAWVTWLFSFFLMFLSLAIYGAVALRRLPLKQWNALPLLAGAPLPAGFLVILILEQFYGTWQVPLDNWFMFILLLITFVSLALLGYRLQLEVPHKGATA